MDLTPLTRFIKKVEELKSEKLERAVIEASRGIVITLQGYIQETYEDATVTLIGVNEKSNHIICLVDIHAKDLWFKEFGTGFVGMTFPSWEYMPAVDLTFFSRGSVQHTSGWEYAYHPQTKKDFGWWYLDPETGRPTFTQGQPAEYGVTKAILRIKYSGIPNLAEWVKMYLR